MNQHKDTTAPFAFRLAKSSDANRESAGQAQWQVREDIAIAGCTGIDTRVSVYPGKDNGLYC